ncbi:MAG: hypothetical protein AB7G10_21505 [Reyranellaceae bacterium]
MVDRVRLLVKDLGLNILSVTHDFPHITANVPPSRSPTVLVQCVSDAGIGILGELVARWEAAKNRPDDELWIVGQNISPRSRTVRLPRGAHLFAERDLEGLVEQRWQGRLRGPVPASVRLQMERGDPSNPYAAFVLTVAKLLDAAGAPTERGGSAEFIVNGLDLFDGDEFLVECDLFVDVQRVEEYIARWDSTNVLAIAEDASPAAFDVPLPPNIKLMSYRQFSNYVGTRREHRKWASTPSLTSLAPTASPAQIAKAVVLNKQSIMVALMGLALTLRNRINELQALRGNSPESQERIEEYEALLARVEALEDSIRSLEAPDPEKVAEPVLGLRDSIGNWWNNNHETVLTNSAQSAIFGTLVTVLVLTGGLTTATAIGAMGLASGKVGAAFNAIGKALSSGKAK